MPAGYSHSNGFESDTRCLIVEIEPAMLERVERHSQILDRPGEVEGPVAGCAGAAAGGGIRGQGRIVHGFAAGDFAGAAGGGCEAIRKRSGAGGAGVAAAGARICGGEFLAVVEFGGDCSRGACEPGAPGSAVPELFFDVGGRVYPAEARGAGMQAGDDDPGAFGGDRDRLRIFRSEPFFNDVSEAHGVDTGSVPGAGERFILAADARR